MNTNKTRAKRKPNKNPYVREGVDMNVEQIAQELNISKTEVETALKGIFYKFRKHFAKNNIVKEHYL